LVGGSQKKVTFYLFDLSKFLFGMLGKIALHHPVVVTGIGAQNFFYGFAFVFAKVKACLASGEDKTSSAV
jgi:hypothetical protein